MADIDIPNVEYQDVLARIRRSNEETEKFIAEQHRLRAEQDKLRAEQDKLRAEENRLRIEELKLMAEQYKPTTEGAKFERDRFMYPISVGLGFLGALLGSAMVLAGHFLR
jgi:hypothetical protein